MFRELDTVALAVDRPADRLARGHVGTILLVLAPNTFEVEFVDDDSGESIVLTLTADHLMPL